MISKATYCLFADVANRIRNLERGRHRRILGAGEAHWTSETTWESEEVVSIRGGVRITIAM